MSWTYIRHDAEAEKRKGAAELPPPNTIYQAFDALRWKRVIGFTEKGGYSSILNPNVCDDCRIIAFAPLTEKDSPSEDCLREAWPVSGGSTYRTDGDPSLLL